MTIHATDSGLGIGIRCAGLSEDKTMNTIEDVMGKSEHSGGGMSVAQFCAWAGIGRTVAYAEIKTGHLRAVKVGRRTIITRADAQTWLDTLPTLKPADASGPEARHA